MFFYICFKNFEHRITRRIYKFKFFIRTLASYFLSYFLYRVTLSGCFCKFNFNLTFYFLPYFLLEQLSVAPSVSLTYMNWKEEQNQTNFTNDVKNLPPEIIAWKITIFWFTVVYCTNLSFLLFSLQFVLDKITC